ncbi:MAG: hypothetical protein JNL62_21960 [Bryobacterales bacterium]|nr:hypothetical protein [Bryobacterales bacterium]
MATATANGTGKVTFEPNIPTQVTLRFNDAKQVTSQIDGGTQYLYSCEEGPMYVSPHVHELIEASGARRGDVLSITKRVRRIGMQQQAHWDVQLITAQATRTSADDDPFGASADPRGNGEPEQPPSPRFPRSNPFPPRSGPSFEERRAQDAVKRAAEIHAEAEARERAAAVPPMPADSPRPAPKSHADALLESLTAAIDAAAIAEKHAARVGMQIRFQAEDVRAMALSLYIARTREGGR